MMGDIELNQAMEARFVNLPGERLIFAQRKHWSVIVIPILILLVIFALVISIFAIAFSYFTEYAGVLIPALLLMSAFILSIGARSIVDWYFNIYVVTNRKIMEISYSPLSSHQANAVLLDQVKCTEIDTKVEGIINDILDVGHITVTFDRPTHQEAFVFEYLANPKQIEDYLHYALYQGTQINQPALPPNRVGVYNRDRNYPGKWTYIEDIRPIEGVAI